MRYKGDWWENYFQTGLLGFEKALSLNLNLKMGET